jgi:Transglycosylase SLT domain
MTKQEIIAIIEREARAAGLDAACMVRIAEIESSFNPNIVNKTPLPKGGTSDASGLYQILPRHRVANVLDPTVNARWAMQYAKQNHELLRKNGFRVDCFTTYLCHQQGGGGAIILLKAARDGKKISDLSSTLRTNIGANTAGQRLTTVEQFLTFWERKIAKGAISRTVTALPEEAQISLARLTNHQLLAITISAAAGIASLCITKFVEKKPLWS